jgi:hypothetical protein
MAKADLLKNDMMRHLHDAMESGQDVGHYGRLVFAMVAHHFMEADELAQLLGKCNGFSYDEARALVQQVKSRNYNPPRRDRIAQWQKEQKFPICPSHDPDACNLYRDLKFPDDVYQHIEEYREAKARAAS